MDIGSCVTVEDDPSSGVGTVLDLHETPWGIVLTVEWEDGQVTVQGEEWVDEVTS